MRRQSPSGLGPVKRFVLSLTAAGFAAILWAAANAEPLATLRGAEIDEEPAPPKDDGGPPSHDTIALLAFDGTDVAGGCSTSGAGGKLPGRVGDSPILGAALYVDDEVGAAGATGLGENVMRHCASYLVVELMREGMHPQAACEEAVHRIAAKDPRGYDLSVSFIALDKQGRYGAASSSQRFPYAVATSAGNEVLRVEKVTPR